MPISQSLTNELTYSEIIIGIIIALILVSLWQRALENFLFRTLHINRKSTYKTFIVAIVFSVLFFVFINVVESLARDVILGVPEGGVSDTQTGSVFSNRRKKALINVDENSDCNGGCTKELRRPSCGECNKVDGKYRSRGRRDDGTNDRDARRPRYYGRVKLV